MNQITKIAYRGAIASQLAVGAILTAPTRALAACDPSQGVNGGVGCAPPSPVSVQGGVTQIINALLWIIGVVSVIMIIVGGLRYVLSAGDPKNTQAAKDTILYAVIGVVVALLAYAIVNFVLAQF